jgi:hypothetical protein
MIPKETTQVCLEQSRLQNEWAQATNSYARLVNALNEKAGRLPNDVYKKLRADVETARKVSARLRNELDLHVMAHGC